MGKLVITEEEKKHILGLYEQSMGGFLSPQYVSMNPPKDVDVDDVVDLASLSLDVIPGIGNLASSAIDVLHSASYYYRYTTESNEDKKMENLFLATSNLLFATIPIAGNLYAMGIRKFIKKFTPAQIKKLLGIPVGIDLGKNIWNYCLIAWLKKYFASNFEEKMGESISRIKNFLNDKKLNFILHTNPAIKILVDYSKQLIPFLENLKGLSKYVNPTPELSKELNF
jgi:hypothetical protein